jgi:hypothetical protein
MKTKAKAEKPPKGSSLSDRFDKDGKRERTLRYEEAVCHHITEHRRHPSGEDRPYFEAEVRVTISLNDGRTLSKVIGIEYDSTDIDSP